MVIDDVKFKEMSKKFFVNYKRILKAGGNVVKTPENDLEYDVHLNPLKNYGLGIMLGGQFVIAFVKQPVCAPMLPWERSGKIVLGDRLISVNNISLNRCHSESTCMS